MFDGLSERLTGVLRRMRGQARISDDVVEEAVRELRRALLEADVALPVVREFLARVREQALGREVLDSLTPGQEVVRVVRDELVALLGGPGAGREIGASRRPPTVVLLCGLQGSGKTTTCGKLGRALRHRGRHPYVVPVDVQRPAAVEQALRVAEQAGVPAFRYEGGGTPLDIARRGVAEARDLGRDVVLVDTAGRLHVDEELMTELRQLKAELEPAEVLYVADAMTGQDAVRAAREFHERVGMTGVILTKLDGDARGGAALSVAAVTGVPVRYVGTGEKADDLETFHADRMASRILGLGDVLSLIERAEEAFDDKEAEALARKLRTADFTLDDFREQLVKVRRMGSLKQLVALIPGVPSGAVEDADPGRLDRALAVLASMTAAERRNHRLFGGSRKRRVARGAGVHVSEVNRLLRQFAQMRTVMRSLRKTGGGRASLGQVRALLGR